MGWLENIGAKFAKKTIAQAYHTGLATGTSNGAKYRNGLGTYAPVTTVDNYSVRAQARQKYKDSKEAKAVIDRMTDMVVDIGLKLEPMPDAKILGLTDDQAVEWADNVKQQYHFWAKSKKCTRAETLNFYQLQRLASISQQRDGEYFVRFQYSNRRDLINPLQLSMVDPQQINGDAFITSLGEFAQQDGIIRDDGGKEIGYSVRIQSKSKPFEEKTIVIPAVGQKSKRTFMVHGFMPEYAGQGRGYSRIMHLLQEFEMLTSYQLAELNKAGNQANIVGFTKPSESTDASNPFEDIAQDTTNPNSVATAPAVAAHEDIQLKPLKEATIGKPGEIWLGNLKAGETIESFKSSISAENFSTFQDAVVEYLAPSMGMPIEVLKMKFTNNYSASRATLILAYRIYEIWREELNTDLNNPTYESWLSEMIASGKIQATGWSDPLKRAAWLSCTWLGASMPNIDPVKTAMANKHNMEMDLTDSGRAARELNGSDAKINKIKNERHFEGAELKPWMKGFGEEPEDNNNNDDEDE